MPWYPVAQCAQLEDDAALAVSVGPSSIALIKVEDRIYATSNICTHQFALMSDGFVEGDTIECPLHQGRFHIPTGKALCAPLSVDLKTYPAKVIDGTVYVEHE